MRPIPGAGAPYRPSDGESATIRPPRVGGDMVFRLVDEATVDTSPDEPQTASSRIYDVSKRLQPSSPSIASDFSETATKNDGEDDGEGENTVSDRDASQRARAPPSSIGESSWSEAAMETFTGAPASEIISQPMTPIFGMSAPSSALSPASSRRNSLTALSSGYPESRFAPDSPGQQYGHASEASNSAPQLIMPTLTIPSRRPFTEIGKSMGRLKVLLAGDTGTGKTSLIKAIVQSCEHIVHVDPIGSTHSITSAKPGSTTRSRSKSESSERRTTNITEIYASTKPYPQWWSELEQSPLPRRRKSIEGMVLDRNICFVDTPGYRTQPMAIPVVSQVIDYVEAGMRKHAANNLSEAEVLNMLGGSGGSLVDVVLYLIPQTGIRQVDVAYLRRLEPLTNVIPLIAHADTLSPDQLLETKARIARELIAAGIHPFTLAADQACNLGASALYAISSKAESDHEIIDASLLMSSTYVQPLVPTDLRILLDHMFCQDGISWMRHSAAKKYLQWQRRTGPGTSLMAVGPQFSELQGIRRPQMGSTSTYALALMSDHTQREERLARVRLANWAADLQRSLTSERLKYESLAKEERMAWLAQQLDDEWEQGALVKVDRGQGSRAPTQSLRRRFRRQVAGKIPLRQDPLGLLQLAGDVRWTAWKTLEIVGSLGLLSGLTIWASRHGWYDTLREWIGNDWGRSSGGAS